MRISRRIAPLVIEGTSAVGIAGSRRSRCPRSTRWRSPRRGQLPGRAEGVAPRQGSEAGRAGHGQEGRGTGCQGAGGEGEEAAEDKDAARKDTTKDKHDKPKKDGDVGSGKETPSAWWPEHVWAHLQSCTSVDVEAGKVDGAWHVWLKYGGDRTYRSASPGPNNVTNHGDKVGLDYAATAVKSHGGWHKAKAGPVSVTVDGPDGQSKTFQVDLWDKVAEDGTCH